MQDFVNFQSFEWKFAYNCKSNSPISKKNNFKSLIYSNFISIQRDIEANFF